ncbi:FAD-dependent monooxygenase [Antrihabitans cavernicola]|uniref:FAD-dependent monooxygenase n=1 Tax=Antrihabitans cavernicola TaxID=2495913 RepID=UPI0016593898|nr:FAD-dependent monooxygenase [Spelaeibacter cavernicola]
MAAVTGGQWDVVVVGAGPAGSLLAGSLAGRGASVLLLERDDAISEQTRASTLNSRSMEIMSSVGVPGLADNPRSMFGHYGGVPVSLEQVDSPWAGLWSIPQPSLVRMLRDWAVDNGAVLKTGSTFVGADAARSAVVSRTATGERYESRTLVGADGCDSVVRDSLGFTLTGTAASRHMIRCDVAGISVARRRFERHGDMIVTSGAISPRTTRLMLHSPRYSAAATPGFDDVCSDWLEATGEQVHEGECVWLDTFSNGCSAVEQWRVGPVYLVGDAAHDQPPVGGSSLNASVQDVYNLAWKLSAVYSGAPTALLDTYGSERAEATAVMQQDVRVQESLVFGADLGKVQLVRDRLAESEPYRQRIARSVAGVDTDYAASTETGSRVSPAALARMLGRAPQPDEAALLGREAIVVAGAHRDDVLCVIRPDGHAAWEPANSSVESKAAIARWFGDAIDPMVLSADHYAHTSS